MKGLKILPNGRMVFKERITGGKSKSFTAPLNTLIFSDEFVTNTGWAVDNTWEFVGGLHTLGSITTAEEIIDSYSEDNRNTYTSPDDNAFRGQTFSADKGGTLSKCKFHLCKQGTTAGNLIAYLYEHTGTYGSGGKPTGSPLATSNTVDILTLNNFASFSLITFTFTDGTLVAGTKYCIVLKKTSGILYVGIDNTSPTHSGNYCLSSNGTTWLTSSSDLPFYVYANITTIVAASPVIRDLGLVTNKAYRISIAISGTAGTLTVALGNGTSQSCSPGTTTFTGTQGSGYFTMTPSNDFDGTITKLTINEV